jgi:sugar phosphate isomerase/epimerase
LSEPWYPSRYLEATDRIHHRLAPCEGEVDWHEFFGSLRVNNFDGIMTVSMFA